MNMIDQILTKWRADGVHVLAPYEREQVVTSLSRLGRDLSHDVTEQYSTAMADGEVNSLLWSLWPLDRSAAENKQYQGTGILFADFLINSHCYLFRYENAEGSSVNIEYANGEQPQRAADSVYEFFELYLMDPERIGL